MYKDLLEYLIENSSYDAQGDGDEYYDRPPERSSGTLKKLGKVAAGLGGAYLAYRGIRHGLNFRKAGNEISHLTGRVNSGLLSKLPVIRTWRANRIANNIAKIQSVRNKHGAKLVGSLAGAAGAAALYKRLSRSDGENIYYDME